MRTYLRVRANRADEVSGEVVREQPLTIWVNGEKFLTLLCSPVKLEALVVGYLWMERVIEDHAEIIRLDVSAVDRSEERRVGKEWRCRSWATLWKKRTERQSGKYDNR